MKTSLKYLVGLALLSFTFTFYSCQPELNHNRLMSYNVRNGKGIDNTVSLQRVADVINNAKPDVVAVQELDSVTKRSKQVYVLGELAKLTGMHDVYAPAIDFSGGKYGIGMLVKEQPLRCYRHALPGREEQRALLLVEFKDYVYGCMHLSLTEEDRLASIPVIVQEIERFKKPVFIAGDWNDTPNSEFITQMQKHFTLISDVSKFTFPADKPDQTIDYIAVSKLVPVKFEKREPNVINAPVQSDHRPIMVDIDWRLSK